MSRTNQLGWWTKRPLLALLALVMLAGIAIDTPARAESSPTPNRPKISHPTVPDLVEFVGSWIWDKKTHDRQACQLWRAFDIPDNAKIIHARLLLTADNEFTVFLDGREIGHGAEWRELFDYNLAALLSPGRHVLAVEAFSPTSFAGLLLGLRIELANGQRIEIKSDQDWKIVPQESKSWKTMTKPAAAWPAATVVGSSGSSPWWTTPDNVNAMLTPLPLKIYFWESPWFQIPFFILCGLIALTIFFLVAQIMLHQKERWLLQRERARIAMDIHDDVGSRMTHLVLNGEVAQEELPVDSKVRTQLEHICDDARGVLASIDEILWALNPRRDTLQDFADYVCDYAQKFLSPANIECVFEVESDTLKTIADLPLRRSLLMAIKETLNNTVKYSGATEFRLQIHRHRHNLSVIVQDNGRGFDPHSVRPGRHGLGNISRRMQELGGSCRIVSESGHGCRVELSIPLRSPRRLSLWWKRQSPSLPTSTGTPSGSNSDGNSTKE